MAYENNPHTPGINDPYYLEVTQTAKVIYVIQFDSPQKKKITESSPKWCFSW